MNYVYCLCGNENSRLVFYIAVNGTEWPPPNTVVQPAGPLSPYPITILSIVFYYGPVVRRSYTQIRAVLFIIDVGHWSRRYYDKRTGLTVNYYRTHARTHVQARTRTDGRQIQLRRHEGDFIIAGVFYFFFFFFLNS